MQPIIFPLARFGRFFHIQEADLMVFEEECIRLMSAQKEIRNIPYNAIKKFEFKRPNSSVPGFVQTMIGTGWMRGEPRIELALEEEFLQLTLEINVRYANAEIARLQELLAQEGVDLSFV